MVWTSFREDFFYSPARGGDGGGSRNSQGAHVGRPSVPGERAAARRTLPRSSVADTQYYASTFPEVLAAKTRWILEERARRHIAGVLQLGDIVDKAADESQWKAASASLRTLDGQVPYILVPGNHDTDANRAGPIDKYFASATMPWITGTMVPGKIENNYALVDVAPRQWLILGLEFAPRDAVLAWANKVLKTYARLPAIVVTHAYLYEDGSRYGMGAPGAGDRHPASSALRRRHSPTP